jgi:predicted  nucleic acid-binding Zn-ribbon protein
MEEQDNNNNIKVNAMLLRAMKHLESNRNDGVDVQTMMIETTTLNAKRGGNHRLRARKGTAIDSSSYSAFASQSASKKTSTKSLSKVTLNELKQRARNAREGYVLSEKAILAGGDRETKFGYCLMYLNAIQKSVNEMCLGGVDFEDARRRRRRYPWEAFDEPDEEDDLEKKRVKRKKQNEEREREKKLKKKKEETTLHGKEARGGGVMKVVEEEDAKALAPLTTMANAKSPRKRGAEGGEENVVVDEERTTTNKKPTMAVRIIKPGRYPGEYCQLCGEHEHMVHVKYESQVLGEGKLVCYGCLVKEKKELEKKQRELTSAKERQKRKELTKAARRKIDETITVTSPMTTPNTTTTHSYSSPVSGAPNAVALPQQQQSSSSPISEADVLVVDGETVTPTATTRTTDVALHTAEKIEAIHDLSIVCDRCGKDNFRAAGELERHKTTQCIIAKTSEAIISDSLIETAVTTTTTSENENEAKQGERDGENVGKIIVANAIANIISEEGEANEKLQQDDTREIREEAFVERSREQNLSREEVKNEELIDEEEERGKEETTVFVDVNTAADVPRKGCQSSSHKSEKRRELPLAEILHIAKDGFPFTKHASSGNISPPSVVISDSVHENTINTIEPANLEQEERRRKAPVSPLDENKEDKKKRLSGPSMKESDERVREMKEWRTENVHALHHGY